MEVDYIIINYVIPFIGPSMDPLTIREIWGGSLYKAYYVQARQVERAVILCMHASPLW